MAGSRIGFSHCRTYRTVCARALKHKSIKIQGHTHRSTHRERAEEMRRRDKDGQLRERESFHKHLIQNKFCSMRCSFFLFLFLFKYKHNNNNSNNNNNLHLYSALSHKRSQHMQVSINNTYN